MKKIIFILFTPFLLTACSMSYVEEGRSIAYEGFGIKVHCGQTPYQESESFNPPPFNLAANVNVPDKIATSFKLHDDLVKQLEKLKDQIKNWAQPVQKTNFLQKEEQQNTNKLLESTNKLLQEMNKQILTFEKAAEKCKDFLDETPIREKK